MSDTLDLMPEAVKRLKRVHRQVCFESGDHPDEIDTPYSLGADALERVSALSAKLEALEAQIAQRDAALKAADVLARVSQTLLDEYGFASDGSDNYREVRVRDIAGLDNARAVYRKARGQDAN